MYTVQETLDQINRLDGWGELLDTWSVEDRTAIVWNEEVEDKHGNGAWRTSYAVRYWENNEWIDTRFFFTEDAALDFARDFVNGPHRMPYPTD